MSMYPAPNQALQPIHLPSLRCGKRSAELWRWAYMKQSLLGVALLLLAGCHESQPAVRTPASFLSTVNASDGVTRSEAERIAEAYFAKHVGCGAYSGISEADGAWVVEGKHGFAGDPIQGFLINKRSGAITSPVGPSYARPQDMLRQAQQGAAPDPHASRHLFTSESARGGVRSGELGRYVLKQSS